jgi:hypothetical protein
MGDCLVLTLYKVQPNLPVSKSKWLAISMKYSNTRVQQFEILMSIFNMEYVTNNALDCPKSQYHHTSKVITIYIQIKLKSWISTAVIPGINVQKFTAFFINYNNQIAKDGCNRESCAFVLNLHHCETDKIVVWRVKQCVFKTDNLHYIDRIMCVKYSNTWHKCPKIHSIFHKLQ